MSVLLPCGRDARQRRCGCGFACAGDVQGSAGVCVGMGVGLSCGVSVGVGVGVVVSWV